MKVQFRDPKHGNLFSLCPQSRFQHEDKVPSALRMFCILAGLCAAIGWGIEGAVGGYACCMVDYAVAIVIRQITSGIVNGVILVSLLSVILAAGTQHHSNQQDADKYDRKAKVFMIIYSLHDTPPIAATARTPART